MGRLNDRGCLSFSFPRPVKERSRKTQPGDSGQTAWESRNKQLRRQADQEPAVSGSTDSIRDLEFKAGSVFQTRMRNSEVEFKRHGGTRQKTRISTLFLVAPETLALVLTPKQPV